MLCESFFLLISQSVRCKRANFGRRGDFTLSEFLNKVRAMRKQKSAALVWLAILAAVIYLALGTRAANAQSAAPTVDPKVPTPVSVLGHAPGDDFYLANYDESRAYFHKLAESSNRIKIYPAGKTTRGLDFEYAVISSPENLAQLDKFKGINRDRKSVV